MNQKSENNSIDSQNKSNTKDIHLKVRAFRKVLNSQYRANAEKERQKNMIDKFNVFTFFKSEESQVKFGIYLFVLAFVVLVAKVGLGEKALIIHLHLFFLFASVVYTLVTFYSWKQFKNVSAKLLVPLGLKTMLLTFCLTEVIIWGLYFLDGVIR